MIRLALLLWILLEVAVLALAGRLVGMLGTLALVLATALLGGLLLRAQGRAALDGLRTGVRRGGDPLRLLLRDGFRLVAALLLILPGLLGDAVGLLLLAPPVQRAVAADLARRGRWPATLARAPRGAGTPGPARDPARDIVIEAEWEELGAMPGDDPAGPRRSGGSGRDSGGGSGWTRP